MRRPLPAASAEIEHERRVAVFDLVEKNSFEPAGAAGGPYALRLSSQDGRLVFDIAGPQFTKAHGLSMSPLNKTIKDYIDICDSYYEVLRGTDVSKIEAIGMAKEELAGVSRVGQRSAAQRDVPREARERSRDHRPHRGQDAQEPHPRFGRRQGPGRDDALRPDQGPHHLPRQAKGARPDERLRLVLASASPSAGVELLAPGRDQARPASNPPTSTRRR
jgi:uncharacterized protein (UPF0262 family)